MTRDQLQACTKDKLIELARRCHVVGWHGMRKDDLIKVLARKLRAGVKAARPPSGRSDHPVQAAAARNTSGGISPEEDVERSKYDVGVPTRDLSAKVPKDLPAGYGKDRIVVMVRDPYWLHCYWELTRHAIQRAEAALGQEWHTGQADPAPPRREQPRHDQHRPKRRSATSTSTAAATTGTSTSQPAHVLPHRHRLPRQAAAGSTSWPAPTSSPRRGPASAT